MSDNIRNDLRRNFHNEYDDEPVVCCGHCLSLNIRGDADGFISYCDDCGRSDNILIGSVFEWERMYNEMFNKNYIDDGREQTNRGVAT